MTTPSTERLLELAEMFERDAKRTLENDSAHYWHDGKKWPSRDKVDWALGQLERAAALRSLAGEGKSNAE